MQQQIIDFLKQNDITIMSIGAIVIVILLVLFRKKINLPLNDLVNDAILKAEESFNSGEGKKKLEFALKYIDENVDKMNFISSFIIKTFFTKKKMIDLIEKTLNEISKRFGKNTKIDIKGNED